MWTVRRFLVSVVLLGGLLLIGIPALAGTDVAPGQQGFEPTNAVVNPQNPSQVAVMQACQVRISNDFGQTFPVVRNTTLGACNGDPTMAFDSQGRLFVSHLSRSFPGGELTVVVAQIADTTTAGALNYTPVQVSATDGNDDDKQWIVADANPSSPYADNLYIVWTRFTGIGGASGGPTAIQFSRSLDQGANWSAQQTLSLGGDGFVWPSHIAVGPNGDVYVSFHTNTCGAANTGTIPLLRDGSGGANFAAGVVPQRNNAFGAGQATVTCNAQSNPLAGTEIPGADFWLQGSMQPWILPDPVRAGNVYVVDNDDPNNTYGNGDDADVVIARSADNGVTFTRGRVDNGPGQSFAVMPTAHIDQDGNIAVSWYDNRAGLMNTGANANFGNPNFLLDLYGTTSNDGGNTFVNDVRLNDARFDPDVSAPCRFGSVAPNPPGNPAGNNCTPRIGEYNGIWTVDGIAYATWTGNATPPVAPFPSDGAGAQTTYFDLFSMAGAYPDRFEPNESIDFAVVAALGADNTYNEAALSLHTATDVDFFKVLALHTGKLEVEIEFNEVIADLEVLGFDSDGDQIATGTMSTSQPGSSTEAFAIPVVQGETYFIEVLDPNAPNTLAPQSNYDLTIINRPAPVPFELDLVAASDTGGSASDDVTNDNTPTIRLRVDDADFVAMGIPFDVEVFDNGNPLDSATPVGGQPGVYTFTPAVPLLDGPHSLTARVEITDDATPTAAVGFGGESDSLTIQVDTTLPATPAAPDLLASSDSAGISIDNITTLIEPAFDGTAETNSLVRILGNGVVVGQNGAGSDASDGSNGDGLGAYEITVEPLADGVYAITATAEDLAGNISAASTALSVTIANQSLSLSGATTGVVVDLDAGTVTGYPGIPGGIVGIVGIPTVNLDVSGEALTIFGTPSDDGLTYTPTGSEAGTLTRQGSSQVINFTAVTGDLTIDPLGGTDAVSVVGTAAQDSVVADVADTTTVQVNALKTVQVLQANVEQLVIATGNATDTIDVTIHDTVNAALTVDGGLPSPNKPRGDNLFVRDGSGKAKIQKQSGPVKGAGSVVVDYVRTTSNLSRVDFVGIEKVRTFK